MVVKGDLKLGTFLATFGIFNQMSSDFGVLYVELIKVHGTIKPLRFLTHCLNLASDLPNWKKVNRTRRAMTKEARKEVMAMEVDEHTFRSDLIPIKPLRFL